MTLSVAKSYREACVTSYQERLPMGSAHNHIGLPYKAPCLEAVQAETGSHLAASQALYVGVGLDDLRNAFQLGVSKFMLLFVGAH